MKPIARWESFEPWDDYSNDEDDQSWDGRNTRERRALFQAGDTYYLFEEYDGGTCIYRGYSPHPIYYDNAWALPDAEHVRYVSEDFELVIRKADYYLTMEVL